MQAVFRVLRPPYPASRRRLWLAASFTASCCFGSQRCKIRPATNLLLTPTTLYGLLMYRTPGNHTPYLVLTVKKIVILVAAPLANLWKPRVASIFRRDSHLYIEGPTAKFEIRGCGRKPVVAASLGGTRTQGSPGSRKLKEGAAMRVTHSLQPVSPFCTTTFYPTQPSLFGRVVPFRCIVPRYKRSQSFVASLLTLCIVASI